MQIRFFLRYGVLLASVLLPVALFVAGCGGATDGSKPSDFKVNDPRVSGDLTFSDVTGGSLVNATSLVGIGSIQPATLVTARTNGGTSQNLELSVSTENAVVTTLSVALNSSVNGGAAMPFGAGQRLEFPRAGSDIQLTQSGEATQARRFRAVGGAIVVRGLSASSAELQLDGVRFEPVEAGTNLGSFTLNGTLTARALVTRG